MLFRAKVNRACAFCCKIRIKIISRDAFYSVNSLILNVLKQNISIFFKINTSKILQYLKNKNGCIKHLITNHK